jgi:nitroimidazol reductase NimA-like FMN-containing flavoprotein (pyridoxamine 5'-phosphate oxidase superfamily)
VSREKQIDSVREILRKERFAVFAFAGEPGEPPYANVMFFAETPDLGLVFGTHPGPSKRPFARPGNGVCAQVDTRAAGLEDMNRFDRVAVRGFLHRAEEVDEVAALQRLYLVKLPFAKPFLERPGVETFVVRPRRIICARGLGERFEVELPASGEAR